jgi:hypothetical protein
MKDQTGITPTDPIWNWIALAKLIEAAKQKEDTCSGCNNTTCVSPKGTPEPCHHV